VSTPIMVTRRRTSLAVPAVVALVVWVVGWAGNGATMVVSEWTGWLGWVAVPLVSLTVAVLTAVAKSYVEDRLVDPETRQPLPDPAHPDQGGRRFTGWSLASALVTLVLVAGVAGLGVTAGVRYVSGWVTGDEPGFERLVRPVTEEAQGLAVTVHGFEETRHFTRLRVEVRNGVGNPITLPLFGNSSLVGGDGTGIEVDHWRSDWTDSLNPGVRQNGVLVLKGHLPDGVRRAQLQFNTVFEQGFEGPDSITVSGIELRRRS
jgi:hypothetical protein